MQFQKMSKILGATLISLGLFNSELLLAADDPIAEALNYGKGPPGNSEQKNAYNFLVGNPPFKAPPRVGAWRGPELIETVYYDNKFLNDESIEALKDLTINISHYDWEVTRTDYGKIDGKADEVRYTFKPNIDVPEKFIREKVVNELLSKGIAREFPKTFRYTKFFKKVPSIFPGDGLPGEGEFRETDLPLANHENYKYLLVEGYGTIVLQALNQKMCNRHDNLPHPGFTSSKIEVTQMESLTGIEEKFTIFNGSSQKEKLYFVAAVYPEAFTLKAIAEDYGIKQVEGHHQAIVQAWEGFKFALSFFPFYGTAVSTFVEYFDCATDIKHCTTAEFFMNRELAETLAFDSVVDTVGLLALYPKYAKIHRTLWLAGVVGTVGMAANRAQTNGTSLSPTDYARFVVLALVAPTIFKDRTPQKVLDEVDGILRARNEFDPGASKVRLGNSATLREQALFARMNFKEFTVDASITRDDLARRIVNLYPDIKQLSDDLIESLVRSYVKLMASSDETVKGLLNNFHDPGVLRGFVKKFQDVAADSQLVNKGTFTSTVEEWKAFILKETGNPKYVDEFVSEISKAERKLVGRIIYERDVRDLNEEELISRAYEYHSMVANDISGWFRNKVDSKLFPDYVIPDTFIQKNDLNRSFVNSLDFFWGSEASSILRTTHNLDKDGLDAAQRIFARMQSWSLLIRFEETRHYVQYGNNNLKIGYDLAAHSNKLHQFMPLQAEAVNFKAWTNGSGAQLTLQYIKDNRGTLESRLGMTSQEVDKFILKIDDFYLSYSMALDRERGLYHESEVFLELLKHADMSNLVNRNIVKGFAFNHLESRPTALIWYFLENNKP